jgi:hypothetical protein
LFLPEHVALKSQKQGEEIILRELFDIEVKACNLLKPLQGVVIPRCYGLCYYQGSRALILEHLAGVSLVSPEGATLKLEELSALLQPCYRAMHAFKAHQDDVNLANFQLVDGKIMVLDLENVIFDLSEDRMARFMRGDMKQLADQYQSIQDCYVREGCLEAA